ncbi:MAG: type IV pilus secretin PilQ [Desulfobacterales bacterium]
MKDRIFRQLRFEKLVLVLLLISAFGWGCSANRDLAQTAPVGGGADGAVKKISRLDFSTTGQVNEIRVEGGPDLLCSHFKKPDPLSLSFYFPQTALDAENPVVDENHPFISEIRASQLSASGQTAKILVSLKKDVEYEVSSDTGSLRIHLKAAEAVSEALSAPAAAGPDTLAAEDDAAEPSAANTAEVLAVAGIDATRMESIDARDQAEGMNITVFADGSIEDFSSFTINDPPRIVFDLYGLESPYSGLQKIDVDSTRVTSVRHFAYPDKIRLVVDTQAEFLTAFTSKPVSNGLQISIGGSSPVPSLPEVQTVADTTADKQTAASAAWLNKIEFSGEDAGRSSVLVGTTGPVRYEMEKIGERELQLKLFGTRVPQYRKRPLITTRFNSAVDRITPVQTSTMGDTAIVNFELREAVPYEVTQENNLIRVRFAASNIPPKPLEQSAMPEWQQVLEGKTASAAGEQPESGTDSGAEGDADWLVRPGTAQEEPGTRAEIREYTGEKIALNFYETDIKNVFRILGEISQQNFAIDKDVTGKVTLNFEKPVPWDQVLDLVLKMNKLGRTMEGDIIRIATLQTLAAEESEQRRKLAEKQAREDQEDLETVFLRLSYIDAIETARDHLVDNPDEPPGKWKSKFNPDRGKVSVDPKQNMIVVTDVPRVLTRASGIVTRLDKVTPQVVIEARIIETTSEFSREVGFDWGRISIGAFGLGDWGQITGINLLANNSISSTPTGAVSFGFSKLGGTSFDIVDATLEVSESQGQSKTISAPKVLTLDGKQAIIRQGFEIPYEVNDSAGGSTVEFKEALLSLSVTPQVTPDDRISLKLSLLRDEPIDISQSEPPLIKNSIETELLVEDGETIVIGGIIKDTIAESEAGIPGLRRIPALGYLFGTKGKNNTRNEVLIFMTPKIVKLEKKDINVKL